MTWPPEPDAEFDTLYPVDSGGLVHVARKLRSDKRAYLRCKPTIPYTIMEAYPNQPPTCLWCVVGVRYK